MDCACDAAPSAHPRGRAVLPDAASGPREQVRVDVRRGPARPRRLGPRGTRTAVQGILVLRGVEGASSVHGGSTRVLVLEFMCTEDLCLHNSEDRGSTSRMRRAQSGNERLEAPHVLQPDPEVPESLLQPVVLQRVGFPFAGDAGTLGVDLGDWVEVRAEPGCSRRESTSALLLMPSVDLAGFQTASPPLFSA